MSYRWTPLTASNYLRSQNAVMPDGRTMHIPEGGFTGLKGCSAYGYMAGRIRSANKK